MTLVPVSLPNYNKEHHKESGFRNPPDSHWGPGSVTGKFREMLKFAYAESDVKKSIPHRTMVQDLQKSGVRVYWIGHATLLVQINEIAIITDPVFGNSASPIPFSVRRQTPLPCKISDLPKIDVILISHCHWDHLEASAISQISEAFPEVKVFAPLQCAKMIINWGYKCEVIEFDWRQYVEFKGVKYTCLPARHHTARFGWDLDKMLWCSWLIESPEICVYFPGDTAVGDHFAEIKETFERQVDLVAIPIGPQNPHDTMRTVHVGPDEAFAMTRDLGAKLAFPIHYGTFPLGLKTEIDDIELLKQTWEGDNLVIVPVGGYLAWNGESFIMPEFSDLK